MRFNAEALMSMTWVVLPVVVLVPATMLAFAIAMLADAWARPSALWERAGRSDRRWWLIALAISVIPIGWRRRSSTSDASGPSSFTRPLTAS